MPNQKEMTFVVEVVREDRAVVHVDATNEGEAYIKAEEAVKAKGFTWAREGNIISNITGAQNKE